MKIGQYTKECFRKKEYKRAIVHLIIDNDWFNNRGKFKSGDRVKYNLFAEWYLTTLVPTFKDKIYTVRYVKYTDKSGVDFVEGGGCDVFWIKKVKSKP